MEYTLPFTGSDGNKYELRGVKHMPGADCGGILTQVEASVPVLTSLPYCCCDLLCRDDLCVSFNLPSCFPVLQILNVDCGVILFPFLQVTTLYSHVWGPNPDAPNASIARTGITKINATDTIDLLKSIRVTGGSGPGEQLNAFLNFSMFLLGDVGHNCINLTADRMLVEYVIPSHSFLFSCVIGLLLHTISTLTAVREKSYGSFLCVHVPCTTLHVGEARFLANSTSLVGVNASRTT